MAFSLRVCLFNPSPGGQARGRFLPEAGSSDEPFRAPFDELDAIQIIAECATWAELQELLNGGRIDVVIVNLDSGGDNNGLALVQRIAAVAREPGIIGVSRDARLDAIIAAMRAGCSQFVRWPIDLEDLRAAVDRIRQVRLPGATSCWRICVVGCSGGAGATTIACNLAMELAHVAERRCGLVDMDLQYGDIACSFDVKPRYSIADVCGPGVESDRTMLETALEDLPCNVSILSRPEVELADEVDPNGVKHMFRVMAQMFPFVVVDLPRYFSPPALAALEGADRVLIVTQLSVPHLRNVRRIYDYLLRMGAAEERVDLVLNRSNAHFERVTCEEAERHLGRPVFATIPNDYKQVGASRDLGHPIVSAAPRSPARLAIRELAQRLASEHLGKDAEANDGGVFGLFRRPKKPQLTA